MALPPNHLRVAIVGASTLRGKELKELLEERSFPARDIRLIDEEAVGTLTEAGGEATFIHAMEEDSFDGVQFAFFAGEIRFASRAWPFAHKAGATVIDLSGALAEVPTAVPWIPALDSVLPPPRPVAGKLFASPAAPTIMACSVAVGLSAVHPARLALVFFQPVSERGQAGIEELEKQTVNLLSLQPISQELYDAQVAFNLLPRYGEASRERLGDIRLNLAREVDRYLAGRSSLPAVQLVQAPVFYCEAMAGYAEFEAPPSIGAIHEALGMAGVRLAGDTEPPVSNISLAGEGHFTLAHVEPDPLRPNGVWLWGGSDNVRLAALNAVQIAEKLLGTA
jgi:aspartate-semialdehyde dehydrogenase